ncbi:MAG: hypothetical protein ACRC23_01985 [Aeromonas jandaei]
MTTLKYDIQPIEYNGDTVEAMIINKSELEKIFSTFILSQTENDFLEGKPCGKSTYMLQSLNTLLTGTDYQLNELIHFQPDDERIIIIANNRNTPTKCGKVVMN